MEKETEESSDESQCASSGEETEEDEDSPDCATCSARKYLGYLNSLGYFNSEEDETRYLKAEQELEELEVSDLPFCETCFDVLEDRFLEEKKSSRYDSSE